MAVRPGQTAAVSGVLAGDLAAEAPAGAGDEDDWVHVPPYERAAGFGFDPAEFDRVDREQVFVESREQWREWLAARHETAPGAWAVTWKKASGEPHVPYGELVEEALCFGWIDSLGRRLDDERSQLLFTPRKPGSGWSRPNKERIERLLAAGLMEPAGLAAIERAKADGSWTALDAVEALIEPPELAAALDRDPAARREWDAFPRSAKRAILEWIANAKRPETRAKRVAETARLAARGERANQWPRP